VRKFTHHTLTTFPETGPLTEVPEHLLQRSRDRRKALGLAPAAGDTGAAVADVAPEVSTNTPAVAGAAAPAAAAAKVPVPLPDMAPPPPPDPTPPWVNAANDRQKIPAWVMPILLFSVFVWPILYVGTLENPTRLEGLIYEGGEIYAANCAVCHGANGAGAGNFPGFTNGQLMETFPHFEEQIEWVVKGTSIYEEQGRETYGANNTPVGGSGALMPGFADKLTAEELVAVVLYERVELAGDDDGLALAEAVFDAMGHGEIQIDGAAVETFSEDVTIQQLQSAYAEVNAAFADTETAGG